MDDFYDVYSMSSDDREIAKLDSYVPKAPGDTRPWWERVAEYGLTRAIDNQVGPPAQNKTTAPASFAGQNGRTYSQVGSPLQQPQGGMSWLPLVAAGVAAFLLLK